MASPESDRFIRDIGALIAKSKGNLRFTVINFIQKLNVEVIIGSPGPGNSKAITPTRRGPTGFLRGSWYANWNGPTVNAGPADPSGQNRTSDANLVAGQMKDGGTYYLMNGAEYAKRLEYGFVGVDSRGRSYNQAGRFWVQKAISKAPELAKEAAEEVLSGHWGSPTGGISGGSFTAGPASR